MLLQERQRAEDIHVDLDFNAETVVWHGHGRIIDAVELDVGWLRATDPQFSRWA